MNHGPPRRVAIVAALRPPFARSNTAYARLSNKDMLTDVLRGLMERAGQGGVRLGEGRA
jgi:acetyl-CoA C-acetyltransferase